MVVRIPYVRLLLMRLRLLVGRWLSPGTLFVAFDGLFVKNNA